MVNDEAMSSDAPSSVERIRVCFVCSGNICRSPIAEVVMRSLAHAQGLGDVLQIDSAGTGGWHIGDPADERAVKALARAGYDGSAHRARQFEPQWFPRREHVVALDAGHLRTLRSWASSEPDRAKVRLLRSFDPQTQGLSGTVLDVPDPYYGGRKDFEAVVEQVESACSEMLRTLCSRLGRSTGPATA
jgi:protein-tyrosine phosphatase